MLTPSTERLCIDKPSARERPKPRVARAPLQSPLLGGTRPNTLALPAAGRAILLGRRLVAGRV